MRTLRDETAWVVGSLAIGVLLAVGALFSILAGYLLVILFAAGLVLAAPVAMVVAGNVGLRAVERRVAAAVVAAPAVPAMPQAAPQAIPERAVVARLAEMRGVCASKVQYAIGDEFTFEDGKRVVPAMCGPALHGLRPHVDNLRGGEGERLVRVQCPLSGSLLLFELRPKGAMFAAGAD